LTSPGRLAAGDERIAVRRLEPDDWELLREVRLRSLADTPDAFGSTHAREAEYDETRWRELLSGGGWFLAFDGEAPVGIVCGYHDDSSPDDQRHLVAMWVAPQARGTGLAPELVAAVIDWARDDGATEVTLGVADGNERARAVYLRYGFTPTGEAFPLHSDPSRNIEIYAFPV
jgi:RimJ/RimL family protein N-acetyltransferase